MQKENVELEENEAISTIFSKQQVENERADTFSLSGSESLEQPRVSLTAHLLAGTLDNIGRLNI